MKLLLNQTKNKILILAFCSRGWFRSLGWFRLFSMYCKNNCLTLKNKEKYFDKNACLPSVIIFF